MRSNRIGKSKPPTSLDVAEKAGVSQSTVSLVFNGKSEGRVSPDTELRIRRTAEAMGYIPNARARAFRLGRSRTLAMVIPDVSNPFFATVLRGAQREARKNGYILMLVETENDPAWQSDIVDTLLNQAIDGLVLTSVHQPGEELADILREKSVAVESASEYTPSITIDAYNAAVHAVNHLVELGHTKIACISGNVNKETFLQRRAGFHEALASNNIPLNPAYLCSSDFTLEQSSREASRLLHLPDPPSAIFCEDDLIAVGVYKAARALQIRIPEDLSVVGFDDIEIAVMLEPELTTIHVPAEKIGAAAVKHLVRKLEGRDENPQITLACSLIVRCSTSPILPRQEPGN